MNHTTHWLVGVAQRAGLRVADRPEYSDAAEEDVWRGVCEDAEVTMGELAEAVANHFRLEVADPEALDPATLRLVPREVAREYNVVPIRESYHTLFVATADPTNLDAEQAIAFASGRSIQFMVLAPEELSEVVDENYAPERAIEGLLRGTELEQTDVQVVSDRDNPVVDVSEAESEPVIKLTNLIFNEAIEAGASDIHVEPDDHGGTVRIRVDGVLRKHMELPNQALIRVISRIKVLGDLDIADHLRPQDGRARIRVGSHAYDLRISTVPARNSEKAVIRILDPGQTTGGLEDLFIPEPELTRLRRVTRYPDGIVVVTGPTGSGKTTTLYSLLQELATDRVNIMTVEDPVEYRLAGITQIQVETKRGVTFAKTLRAILRQDPDIIFVGEIRDLETAEIAVQASMTGHLVLATLHTNDAPAAVQRLLDLGLDGPSIAGCLRGALAQRLVRTTCTDCMGVGCEPCGHTGYLGRRPVVELMVVDAETTRRIAREAPHPEIREAALASGMRPLSAVGYDMIRSGVSTKEEVERVLGEVTAPTEKAGDAKRAPDQALVPSAESSIQDADALVLPPPEVPEYTGPAVLEPQVRVDAPSRVVVPRPVPPRQPAAQTLQQGDAGSTRVLVVDDDPVSRTLARSLLETAGFNVTEAGDGMGAIQALAAGMEFDLCVLDLNMPNVDGRQVLQQIRSTLATAGLPVIVLTGDNDGEAEIELMQAGADDYIRKPLDAGRFMVRVQATLRRSARQPTFYGGAA